MIGGESMAQQPVRILHVIGIMDRGGAEAMIMNLYRSIDRTKLQFDFVVHGPMPGIYAPEIEALGGIIHHCPRFTPKTLVAYVQWWDKFFRSQGQDYPVVHGHIGSSAAVYLHIAKKHGKYTVAHSHSSGTDHSFQHLVYQFAAFPTRYIAHHFFACSEPAAIDRYGKKVARDERRCNLFHNAIDTHQFSYSPELRTSVRQHLGLSDNQSVIGHVGRFATAKNHTFLLDIFAEAVKKLPELQLLLVGDGPLREQVQEKAKQLCIAENIHFLGIRSDVNQLMAAMDAFLFPSLHEGLPVVLVEAQTTGLPCLISSAIPAQSRIAGDICQVLSLSDSSVQWADKLLDMLAAAAPRKDRIEEVTEKGFDIHTTAKWLEAFYLEKACR